MFRRALTGLIIGTVAAAGVAYAHPAAAEPTTSGPGHYVALGDSAAAGPLIIPQKPGPSACRRSERNFPTVAARILRITDFVDATCSSAVTANLFTAQGDARPQLDAVTPASTVVTLGPIGANDAHLVQLVLDCIVPGCAARQGREPHDRLEETRPRLSAALRTITLRAPRATVVVVGYGRYLPPGGCPSVQPLSGGDAVYIQGLLDHMNTILKEVAAAHSARFVALSEVPNALRHTACATPDQRWLEGLVPQGNDGSIPLHPTARGMRAFAAAVAGVVQGDIR
ncbi:SGNH/GDSL hydrolase family protein [Gordonia insulae]|uniref:Lipase 2 n=1 Tax=Gordonia insulae TaxID=2420509 RepID=A0A3G8JJ72_9ACTN|nr:SGNH/GDSL hydrolase family protein [Gordonia insulae]AZG44529.1 Lipase 2 [Gordonia insulae]